MKIRVSIFSVLSWIKKEFQNDTENYVYPTVSYFQIAAIIERILEIYYFAIIQVCLLSLFLILLGIIPLFVILY